MLITTTPLDGEKLSWDEQQIIIAEVYNSIGEAVHRRI